MHIGMVIYKHLFLFFCNIFHSDSHLFPDHLAGNERMLRQKPTQPMELCQGERTLSMRSLVSLSLDIIMPLIEHFISSIKLSLPIH